MHRVILAVLLLAVLPSGAQQTITCTATPAASVTCTVTPAVVVTPPIIVAPAGTALTACGDLLKSGSFYLTTDVSSPGTCFFIDASGITLNLNGHTITYATVTNAKPTPGIVLADPWYMALAKSGTTSTHGGFVIYGGSILEGAAGAAGSSGIHVGQSGGLSPAPVVHDLTITTTSTDASPIKGDISLSGWQIYANKLSYTSKVTSSRQQMLGYAIWLANQEQAPGLIPDTITGNSILSAPQGGIRDTHQNATIHGNDITFNSYYTNDFCIDSPADGQVIDQNICHPVSGRGLHANANNITLSNNAITVQELSQNAEYGGCELGGAYGIQVEFDSSFTPASPTGIKLLGNIITAVAGNCPAVGMRFTSLTTPVTATANTVTSTSMGTALDYGVQFSGVNLPGIAMLFTGNNFKSKHALVSSDWDGANVSISAGNTWGTAVYTVDLQNGFKDPTEGGPTFAQSMTLGDPAAGTLACGTYASSAVSIGGTILKC
jgi:hypothetical protein